MIMLLTNKLFSICLPYIYQVILPPHFSFLIVYIVLFSRRTFFVFFSFFVVSASVDNYLYKRIFIDATHFLSYLFYLKSIVFC